MNASDEMLEGLGYLYGYTGRELDASGVDGPLGFSIKKIAKGAARGVAKGAKGAAKGAARGVATVAKVAVTPFQLIANLALAVLMKAVLPLARAVCAMPQPVVQASATASGVSVNVVPMFCQAVRVKNWSTVRSLLPSIIKLSVKASAIASVPGLGPALIVVRSVPALRQFAGAGTLGAGEDPVTLLDSMSYAEMGAALNEISDDELAAGLGDGTFGKVALATGLGAAAITGLVFAFRR